ncbi:MAG: Type 1 glutamine amidotransferase-like domain-containing protein [Thermodesulfobacteriota bacterium]
MADVRGPIFLISGGQTMRKREGPDPLLQVVIRRTGVRRPMISYLGTASGDDDTFRLWFTRLLQTAGAGEVTLVPLCGRRGDPERAKAILEASDLVFVSGGDVKKGMRVLVEKKMTGFLRRLHWSGKLFLGVSAGSIMLARKWVCWKDPHNDESAEIFSCLGLAPILCDTHGEGEGWVELKTLLTLSPTDAVGYGIPSGTAIVVEPDRTLSVLGGEVDRFRRRTNGVVRIKGLVPDKNTRRSHRIGF